MACLALVVILSEPDWLDSTVQLGEATAVEASRIDRIAYDMSWSLKARTCLGLDYRYRGMWQK